MLGEPPPPRYQWNCLRSGEGLALTDVERLKLAATGELGATIEIKTQLLARLEAGRGAYLDARDVDEPSLALIQTIEAAAAAFAERMLPFGLIEPSDRLCAAYETVGLFAQLMSRIAPDS